MTISAQPAELGVERMVTAVGSDAFKATAGAAERVDLPHNHLSDRDLDP